jgi:hypothetical protein
VHRTSSHASNRSRWTLADVLRAVKQYTTMLARAAERKRCGQRGHRGHAEQCAVGSIAQSEQRVAEGADSPARYTLAWCRQTASVHETTRAVALQENARVWLPGTHPEDTQAKHVVQHVVKARQCAADTSVTAITTEWPSRCKHGSSEMRSSSTHYLSSFSNKVCVSSGVRGLILPQPLLSRRSHHYHAPSSRAAQ